MMQGVVPITVLLGKRDHSLTLTAGRLGGGGGFSVMYPPAELSWLCDWDRQKGSHGLFVFGGLVSMHILPVVVRIAFPKWFMLLWKVELGCKAPRRMWPVIPLSWHHVCVGWASPLLALG
jgi:hypothetical protein